MKALNKLRNKISSIHYAGKLFYSYFIIVCIMLLIFSTTSTYYSSRTETNQSIYTAKNVLLQTSEFIDYKVSAIKNIINIITVDETIQEAISYSEEYDRNYQNNWVILTTTAKSIMYNANTSKDIHNIRLYTLSGPAAFENSKEFAELSQDEKENWFARTEQDFSNFWLPSSFFSSSNTLGSITYFKKIPDSKNLNQYLGIITATVRDSALQDVISQAATTPNTSVLLYNSFGETIMYHGDNDQITAGDIESFGLSFLKDEDDNLHNITFHNKKYLAGIRPIENCDWNLAMLVPYSDFLTATRIYQKQIFFMAALLFILLIPILYKTSKSLSSRIYILKEYISQAVSSNFQVTPLDNGNDEIGDLTQHFNQMVVQISDLLNEQYNLGYKIKDLEFQVLQSQINPHFLYNTLDMIYWLGLDNHAPDVADAAKELGKFYMLSLGHGEAIVTLLQELDHVRAYVNIQNMRFENHFQLSVKVPEELFPYKMIKIILQPLVENAILHGIREKSTETGTICISATLVDETIEVSISDDGVGMSQDKVKHILVKDKDHAGYGVWNIHERLILSYGLQYGLRYVSRPFLGTTVVIRFPAIT